MAKKKTKAKGRGGARQGAGRPLQFNERMTNCTVALPEKAIEAIQGKADAEGVTWVEWCRKVLMDKAAKKT